MGPIAEKKETRKGLFFDGSESELFAFTTKNTQQSQEALEYVDDVQVQSKRGADVVGFAAVDDLLEVIQHEGAEDEH